MIFCVWLLAFSPQLCEQLRRYNVVPALSDILQESVKEKVTRIILAAFRVRATPVLLPPHLSLLPRHECIDVECIDNCDFFFFFLSYFLQH